ncbi:orotate phosphoribosyltransferase [Nitrococcus mobilis]|uniref:Orotate phosphoribosyltransferase n=1 Tax=Nitrococcus mobilis Nb-231 TaxID=314278 RepID=A4BU17_9GAMM|nr:orotate phosphoribosyltransferase [Nitrococcus mobilis]EAR20838.1 orotate phosphoribosyltransferase [Nitrococcus mobilis Nb-231]
MFDYQRAFIQFALEHRILRFGEFILKSGRRSPYFFNAGRFATGQSLIQVGRYYAQAIIGSRIDFDMLFGPAYKGIPLACATAIALAEHHGRDVPYAFDRKETKTHGEGGKVIGAPLHGRILMIDDVISAGTSVRESVALIAASRASLAGVVIALDRQERGEGAVAATAELEANHSVPVAAIITLDTLIEYLLEQGGRSAELAAMQAYRAAYGASC